MGKPKNAKKVFTGVIFDIYQWGQEMFDGSTATFEMADRKDSTIVIAEFEDKFVMTKQEQPGRELFYSLVSGRIARNQTPEENAREELLEEARMETDDLRLIGEWKSGAKLDYSIFIYVAKDCRRVESVNPDVAGEKIESFLVDFDEFCEILDSDKTRGDGKIIKEFLQNKMTAETKERLRGLIDGNSKRSK